MVGGGLMKRPKQRKHLIVVGLLFLVSLYLLFQKTPWQEVAQQITQARGWLIGLAVTTMGLFFLCEAISLKQLFAHFRYRISLQRDHPGCQWRSAGSDLLYEPRPDRAGHRLGLAALLQSVLPYLSPVDRGLWHDLCPQSASGPRSDPLAVDLWSIGSGRTDRFVQCAVDR